MAGVTGKAMIKSRHYAILCVLETAMFDGVESRQEVLTSCEDREQRRKQGIETSVQGREWEDNRRRCDHGCAEPSGESCLLRPEDLLISKPGPA